MSEKDPEIVEFMWFHRIKSLAEPVNFYMEGEVNNCYRGILEGIGKYFLGIRLENGRQVIINKAKLASIELSDDSGGITV